MVRFTVEALNAQQLALHIEDNGPGMTDAQLARLFQPFERLGKEISNIEGSGLGLIITRSLVEAMGGALQMHSRRVLAPV
jgi:signal transduction histidine kinase